MVEAHREPISWQKVHVFVSSTFNDMHADRDYLVKRVFPELEDWCERRKLRLVDIDLRWGVTEQDATHNKNVVKVCLNRIDDCRPFFLCFLGQRRGWVPKENEVSAETIDAFPDLLPVLGAASVTELEILHALIKPLHQSLPRYSRPAEYYEPAKYAFFYLRSPSYLDELPADPPQLRETYTNESIEDVAERERHDRALEKWREVDIPHSNRPFHLYEARWDPKAVTPELMLPLECPSADPANIERWQRQWQKAAVTATGLSIAADSAEARKAKRFNRYLAAGRLSDFRCEQAPLSKIIIQELQEAIEDRYPDHPDVDHEDELQKEIDQQEQFLFAASEGFIEREGDFAELDDYVDGLSNKLFVLTAKGGMGKSTLLAKWVDRYRRRTDPADHSIHFRFVGQSDETTTVYSLLRLLLREIKEVEHKLAEEIPLDPIKLRNDWPVLLEAIGKRGKTVIVIDALNQLESGLTDIGWLPRELPKNIKLIASFKRGESEAEELYGQLVRDPRVRLAEVSPFEDLNDRRRLVRTYLAQYLKELDAAHLETLINLRGAENPLYLKVVLSELRVFGTFANLAAKIHSDFGDTPVSAFARVLDRLTNDPAYSPIDPKQSVPLLFGLLAHARRGLSVDELTSLFVQALGLEETQQWRDAAADTVHLFLRQVRSFLARREGRYDFFFESFKTAAQQCYVAKGHVGKGRQETFSKRSHQEWHRLLANYFASLPNWQEAVPSSEAEPARYPMRRKVAELPHHLIQGEMLDDIEATLCDLDFVSAKCAAGLVFELQEDYRNAISVLPEAQASLRENRDREKSLALWTKDIIRYSRAGRERLMHASENTNEQDSIARYSRAGRERSDSMTRKPKLKPKPKLPKIPASCRMWNDEEIANECRRITEYPTRLDRLTVFGGFVAAECYPLLEFGHREGFVLQHAWGHAPHGPVHSAAAGMLPGCRVPILLRRWPKDAIYNPKPALLFTLEGHSDEVECVSVTPDGRRAISGSGDKTLRVWDLESGACLRILEGHGTGVRSLSVTADCRRLISGSDDGTLRVWDVESGACLRTLEGHRKAVRSVSMMPDGLLAVSGSDDNTLRVWDIESGRCLHARDGAYSFLSDHDYERWKFAKRGRARIPRREAELLMWNSGESWGSRNDPDGTWFSGVSVTPDGRRAVSTGNVWDLESGRRLYSFRGHSSVSVTPDGRRAVSGGDHNTIRVWDLEQREGLTWEARAIEGHLLTLEGHKNEVRSVSVTPDGRYAATGSDDKTVRVWDLETGACLRTLEGHGRSVNSVSVTADGRRAVSGSSDNTVRVWDVQSGTSPRNLEGHHRGYAASSVTVTPDGQHAVSVSRDKRLRVWNLETGSCLRTLKGHTDQVESVKVTPDGRHAVSGSDDNTLRVWDLENGECLRILKGHSDSVKSVCVMPDGRRAVSAGKDRTLRVWDLRSGPCLGSLNGHSDAVRSLSVTPDGRRVVSASDDKTLRVWDLESGSCLRTLEGHTADVKNMTVTTDGRRAVSASDDNTLRVWDLESGACLRTLRGHNRSITSMSVTLDGRRAVSASDDNGIRVWDLQSGACLHTLEGHSRLIRSVSVTPDGRYAVTGSDDKTLRVWDLDTGYCSALLVARTEVLSVALARNGNTICAGTEGGEMLFRDLHGIEPGPELRPDASDSTYEQLLRRGLELSQREKGDDHEETVAHLHALIVHLQKNGESDEAGQLAQERDRLTQRREASEADKRIASLKADDKEDPGGGFLHYETLHSRH